MIALPFDQVVPGHDVVEARLEQDGAVVEDHVGIDHGIVKCAVGVIADADRSNRQGPVVRVLP